MSTSITIDLEVQCAACGKGLDVELIERRSPPYDNYIDVMPCPDCLKEKYKEGKAEGLEDV